MTHHQTNIYFNFLNIGEVGDITTYLNFLKNLYSKLNETLPIIALSHNGHSNVTNEIVYDSYSAKCESFFIVNYKPELANQFTRLKTCHYFRSKELYASFGILDSV